MEVGRFFSLINEAVNTIKEVGADYIGEPLSDAVIYNLYDKMEKNLDGINSELRFYLGIEVYVEALPVFLSAMNEGAVSCSVKLRRIRNMGF